MGQSDHLHFHISLGVCFHLADGDDLVILSERTSVNGHGGCSDSLVEHTVQLLVFLHVVINRLGSVNHGVGIESVLVELDSQLVDHDVNALDDVGLMDVFNEILTVLKQLNISGYFANDSLLVLIKPFELCDVFQKNHYFSMFGHNKLVGQVGGHVHRLLVNLS